MILCMTKTISKMLSMNEPLYHVQGHIKMLWDNCLLHLTRVKPNLSWWTCLKAMLSTFYCNILSFQMKSILENILKYMILQNLGFKIRPNMLWNVNKQFYEHIFLICSSSSWAISTITHFVIEKKRLLGTQFQAQKCK